MKKLITALVGTGLFLSFNSYAFSSDCSNAGYTSICAPKSCGGFYIGGTALWLQATGTGPDLNGEIFQHAFRSSVAGIDTGYFRSEQRKFDPDYDWGWEAKIGYDLPCTANNIELNYLHYDETTDRYDTLEPDLATVGSYFFPNVLVSVLAPNAAIGTGGLTVLNAYSSLEYKFDKADLVFGRQYNDVCGFFKLHPFVGVRWARLTHDYTTNVDGVATFLSPIPIAPVLASALQLHSNVDSEFRGAGPVFGFDTRFGFCGGFGIVGHFDTALIAGTVETHDDLSFGFSPTVATGFPGLLLDAAVERFDTPDTDRLVASLSGRVGVDYTYCFCNKSSLTIEVGYQASKYFDAIDLIRGEVESPFPFAAVGGIPQRQRINQIVTDNFDLRGPYVNLTYHL